MVTRRRGAAVLLVASWLLVAPPARAAVCAKTGAEAPAVTTLMASKENPASEAWTVSPSCEVTVSKLTQRTGATETTFLKLTDENIARIESLPTNTKSFWLAGYKVARGADLTNARGLQEVTMASSSLSTVTNIKLPDSVVRMYITSCIGVGLVTNALTLCATIYARNFERNAIKSLANLKLPSALISLTLSKNKLAAIDFSLPPNITSLHLDNNPITSLANITFPDSVDYVDLSGCSVSSVRGTRWPSALKTATFGTTPVTTFEVRKSDAALLSGVGGGLSVVTQQSTCEDATAVLTEIGTNTFCVISDEHFDLLYPATAPTVAPTSGPSGSLSDNATSASGSAGSTASAEEKGTSATNSTDNTPTESRRTASSAPPSSSAEATATGSSNSALLIVLVIVGVVLAVVIAVVSYRIFVVSPKKNKTALLANVEDVDASHGKYVSHDATSASNSASGSNNDSNPQLEQLRQDIRKDGRLAPFRIDERDVQIDGVIARGGFGIIYRGKYRTRAVAIKQLLPDTWRENKTLGRFVDEIHLCASLDHPKIVEFVGVTWTSLRDISVVIEFMDGGDLHSVLRGHESPSRVDWTEQWSSRRLKSKVSIAHDIIEAIAYLHALPTPILHRDLKAHNVLLDVRGNAKLSDFGISREIALDHTMTSEIGTVAWIAPEILRGERYSDKADIYSFGVLLVEMDRCKHPYADVSAAHGETGSAYKATQIAVLVSTGELQPTVSSDCPDSIRDLVDACIAFDATHRPSSSHVLAMISRILPQGDRSISSGFV